MAAMRPSIWTVVFLLPVLFVLADSQAMQPGDGCQKRCGDVGIPFPFGIGPGCFLKGFEIKCANGNLPLLVDSNELEVLKLMAMPQPEARVRLPVAFRCYDTTAGADGAVLPGGFSGQVGISNMFRMSNTRNELVVLGCNTLVYTNSGPIGRSWYSVYTGCVAYCDNGNSAKDGECEGIGCCHINIPAGLTDNTMTFFDHTKDTTWSHEGMEFSPCDYAFIVEKNTYNFSVADLKMAGKSTTKPLVLCWK